MVYKIFIHINVFIDFFDVSRKGHTIARQIFATIEEANTKGFISESIINTSEYILTKRINMNVFRQMIIDLMDVVTILPCSNAIISQAYRNGKNDLEDAVLYEIALEHNVDYFITSNITDFKKIQRKNLPAITAQSFLEIQYPK